MKTCRGNRNRTETVQNQVGQDYSDRIIHVIKPQRPSDVIIQPRARDTSKSVACVLAVK